MKIPSYFESVMNISEKSGKEIGNIIIREELPKGHFLFREGELCQKLFFIEKGIARVYYCHESKDITAWFSAENFFLTAIDSFSQNIATRYNCELLEPSIVYSTYYDQLDTMISENLEISRIAFYIVIEMLKQTSIYVTNTKFQSAKERFETLIKNHPTIFLRVSLGHIASVLRSWAM